MKKYFKFEISNYQYGKFCIKLCEFYLLKEGWIPCFMYSDDIHDSRYVLDSKNTPGTRTDYCIIRDTVTDSEIFETIEEAKKFALTKLEEMYKIENFKLLTAHHNTFEFILKTTDSYNNLIKQEE